MAARPRLCTGKWGQAAPCPRPAGHGKTRSARDVGSGTLALLGLGSLFAVTLGFILRGAIYEDAMYMREKRTEARDQALGARQQSSYALGLKDRLAAVEWERDQLQDQLRRQEALTQAVVVRRDEIVVPGGGPADA